MRVWRKKGRGAAILAALVMVSTFMTFGNPAVYASADTTGKTEEADPQAASAGNTRHDALASYAYSELIRLYGGNAAGIYVGCASAGEL